MPLVSNTLRPRGVNLVRRDGGVDSCCGDAAVCGKSTLKEGAEGERDRNGDVGIGDGVANFAPNGSQA